MKAEFKGKICANIFKMCSIFKPIAEQECEYGSESNKTIYCKCKFL